MKTAYRPNILHVALISALLLAACSRQDASAPVAGTAVAEPAPLETATVPPFPERPFFGDTHLHTSMSFDAGMFGAKLGPVEAYRFAKGEEVTSSTGLQARLSRPLDFLVVSDHSDFMGLAPDFLSGKPEVLADPTAKRWFELIREGKAGQAFGELLPLYGAGKMPATMQYLPGTPGYSSAWQATIKAAEQANVPGQFTAFIGYEWTSNTGGNNLHRNVIYRDDGSKAGQLEPFTTFPPLGSADPRELWKWMGAYEQKTGGRLLAIAHNGNLSNGLMFPMIEPVSGGKLDKNYAETRMKWERLYEVTQMKGDSETHPFLSPSDEFANFERWDKSNLDGSVRKKQEMLEFEHARSAYKNGLKLESQLGVNPYKFGLVGSTDSHNSLSAVEENNFFGKMASSEPSPERWKHPFIQNEVSGVTYLGWETQSAGFAAVWARENTRESIFDAMQRKETYATTGPRMTVRLFGGFDFEAADANAATLAKTGYAKGVPMGGDLNAAPAGKVPSFLVAAMKDVEGANLDRYQIVKGWMDKDGKLHEKVYDVAWSAGRSPDPKTGKVPAVGNTVNVADASYTNSIGATELITVWKDPDFDPSVSAFYYGRVLEIPTPRWTAYDAKRFDVKMTPNVPMTVTERAYTSPIWYTPK